jgi:hypothetical protein
MRDAGLSITLIVVGSAWLLSYSLENDCRFAQLSEHAVAHARRCSSEMDRNRVSKMRSKLGEHEHVTRTRIDGSCARTDLRHPYSEKRLDRMTNVTFPRPCHDLPNCAGQLRAGSDLIGQNEIAWHIDTSREVLDR